MQMSSGFSEYFQNICEIYPGFNLDIPISHVCIEMYLTNICLEIYFWFPSRPCVAIDVTLSIGLNMKIKVTRKKWSLNLLRKMFQLIHSISCAKFGTER